MNLMEIGKKPEMKQTETAEQLKNSETITENLTQPSQMTEESPIKLKVERDILIQSFERAKEFMRTQKQQIQTLEEEKQMILSDRQRLREEVRKSTVEIQRLTTELLETQKLNHSLLQSNDDLRNRNGLKSRREQEQLEEEIKDVRDQNCKLQNQVNKSSVEAVDEAQRKQKEAEKKARIIEYQSNKAQEKVKMVMEKIDQEIRKLKNEVKEKEKLWMIVYMILILFAVIKNAIFQKDLFACIAVPLQFLCRYVEWVIRPSELNILGEREYFSAEWSWFLRVMAVFIFLGLGISGEIFVLRKTERYRKVWDKYSTWIILISLSVIAVLVDVVRKYIPINLILILGIVNISAMEIKIYCHDNKKLY